MAQEKLRYEGPIDRSREEISELLESGDSSNIISGLLSATFYEEDWRWVQNQCLRFLVHTSSEVRWAAATFLGNLAVFHKELDLHLVLPALHKASEEQAIRPAAEESLDDIRRFVKRR